MPAPQPPTKQTGGHRGHPGHPYLAWVALLTTAVSSTAVVGCGEVHFLPSPFTPQNVELVYSEQEHLTIVRWRVDATAPVDEARFELLGPDGYQPVDFSRSLFTGGVVACGKNGEHSCAQYVVRGHYPQRTPAGQFRPVRAVHELYGELPGAPAKSRALETSFTMKSFFNFKNDPVFVNLTDTVASDGDYKFPRAFESALWPTAGVCVADTPPDGVVFHPLDLTKGIPPEKPLTAAGRYCVAIRPVPTDNGDRAMLQAPIATLPEVVTARQVLSPPIETSPIIYQVILDLHIEPDDRCAEAEAEIERLTAKYMKGDGAALRKLPTKNLSPGCKQTNDRTVEAAEMADAVKKMVMTFTEVHHQYHFMYFNNLDAPLPPKLTQTLKDLFAALAGPPAGYDLRTIPWLFSPPATAISDVPWSMFSPWKTYDDLEFEMLLYAYTTANLPYRTQLHRSDVPVHLMSPQDVEAYAGKQVKICSSSQEIRPASAAGPIFESTWQITTADPPAYTVDLPEHIAEPASSFVPNRVIVDYQICTRYCEDHGYVTDNGVGQTSWVASLFCASKDY
jgi:hypothetical protein